MEILTNSIQTTMGQQPWKIFPFYTNLTTFKKPFPMSDKLTMMTQSLSELLSKNLRNPNLINNL
jgi:hypothetical protein